MKNKKLLLLSFLVCIAISLTAQRNYLNGSVVLMNGETLKGLIDYRNWERNPVQINFKLNETAAEVNYTVADIKAFEVTGHDQYVRAVVVKDMLPVDLNKLELEGVQKMVNDIVFLRTIVKDEKLSLYELIDDKPHYFIQQKDGEFEELVYRIYINQDDRNITMKREMYKDQLKRFAIEDNLMRKRIDNASYQESDLVSVVRRLNGTSIDEKQTTGTSVAKSRFLAGAGVSMNKIDFKGAQTDLSVLNENFTPGISIGAGIDLLSKRDFQRLFFRFIIGYHTMSYKGEAITEGPLTNQKQKREYELKMNMVNPGVYIFYTIMRNQVGKLHLGFGAGYNFTSYPTNTYTKTDMDNGEVSTKEDFLEYANWLDAHGKLGYVIKNKFEIELDTRIIGSFSEYTSFSSKATSYRLSVHRYF